MLANASLHWSFISTKKRLNSLLRLIPMGSMFGSGGYCLGFSSRVTDLER